MKKQKIYPSMSPGWHAPMALPPESYGPPPPPVAPPVQAKPRPTTVSSLESLLGPGWHPPKVAPTPQTSPAIISEANPLPPTPVATQIDGASTPGAPTFDQRYSEFQTQMQTPRPTPQGYQMGDLPGAVPERSLTEEQSLKRSMNRILNQDYSEEDQRERERVARSSPAYQEQEKAIQDYQTALLTRLSQPVSTDYSPLIGYLDQLSGSSNAKNYKFLEPENPLPYLEKLVNQKTTLNKDLREGLKSQSSGKITDALQSLQLKKYVDSLENPSLKPNLGAKDDSNLLRVMGDFDTKVKPFTDAREASAEILRLVTSKDWLSKNAIQSLLVEAAKLKPVSDLDLSRYGGSPDWWSIMERIIKKIGADGDTYTQEDRAVIEKYARGVYQASEGARLKKLDDFQRNVLPAFRNLGPGAGGALRGSTDSAYPEPKPAKTAPVKKGPNKIMEETLKTIRENRTGKPKK